MYESDQNLALADKGGSFAAVPSTEGLYEVGGSRYPKVAVGQSAAVFLERDDGGYDIILTQRAMHLNHGGKWALFGGYLEVRKSEGPSEAIWRETREESNGTVELGGHAFHAVLPPFMDYEGGATICLSYVFVLRGDEATKTRIAVEQAIETKTYDSETMCMEIARVDKHLLDNIAGKGGFGYLHELRFLRMALSTLEANTVPRIAHTPVHVPNIALMPG